MSVMQDARIAYGVYRPQAEQAERILTDWCGRRLERVPGMDTVIRLAYRLYCGRTIEEAAGREYLYRWHLALQSPVFGVPHPIGL